MASRLCLSGGGYRAMLFHVGRRSGACTTRAGCERLDRVSSVSGGSITAGALALAWPRLAAEGLEASFVEPGARAGGPHRRRGLGDRRSAHARTRSPSASPRPTGAPVRRRDAAGPARPPALRHQRDQRAVGRAVPVLQALHGRLARRPVDHPRRRARRRGRGLVRVPARPLPFTLDLHDAQWVDEPRQRPRPGEYRERAVLSDGGVYDNLGLETAWKACRTVLVCDAGGQMAAEPDPDHDWGRHRSACSA